MKSHDPIRRRLHGFVTGSAVLALAALLAPAPAPADTAAEKAGRGLAAMTTGFLEIPGNMVETADERGNAIGLPLGFAKGLGMVVVRELVGVYEFVTAPIPAPDNFEPIIAPEYPWGYFEEGEDEVAGL